jgi:hypothetical protein
LIRHPGLGLALAVLPLPVPVIQPSLRTLLVAAIGATTLVAPRRFTAGDAAVAVSAITARADQECRATLGSRTKPLSQNQFCVFRHAPLQAALDNGDGFVAPLNHVLVCGHAGRKSWNLVALTARFLSASTTQYNLRMFQLMIGRMIRACGTDDAAGSARVQISTLSYDR